MDFPSNKPSTLWGAPILGNPQIAKGQVRAEQNAQAGGRQENWCHSIAGSAQII